MIEIIKSFRALRYEPNNRSYLVQAIRSKTKGLSDKWENEICCLLDFDLVLVAVFCTYTLSGSLYCISIVIADGWQVYSGRLILVVINWSRRSTVIVLHYDDLVHTWVWTSRPIFAIDACPLIAQTVTLFGSFLLPAEHYNAIFVVFYEVTQQITVPQNEFQLITA